MGIHSSNTSKSKNIIQTQEKSTASGIRASDITMTANWQQKEADPRHLDVDQRKFHSYYILNAKAFPYKMQLSPKKASYDKQRSI
jgi:hypothetical protein